MALQSTEAFVLRTYSLAEAHKICVFFTRDLGKIRGVAHGARKMTSRFGSALEPFTQVAITYYKKEGRELVSVSSCDIVSSNFYSAASDLSVSTAFSYMCELLMEFLPDEEPNEKMYRLVVATLDAVKEQGEVNHLLRYFECWTLRLMGFFPDLSTCSICGEPISESHSVHLATGGTPHCLSCSSTRETAVSGEIRETIRRIFRLSPGVFGRSETPIEHLTRIDEINYGITRTALERDLKSRGLLKRLVGAHR